ncbi:Lipase 2 [Streptomyces ambofaciens ATCC 23877]|uniref:Lipase 2 n=1 Tax=Streptomyces ambofaciens (strain ATCC 23877 / 3486 / DSM 40053 / JCM 4204 / NBRC 12836 / NRRL B-2516) TaxID=278992 RepID=A0ACN1_STRA7|nr:SGNH/GDSL hydrolase family protein [Streptomyces ambofaciens]AKZ60107.1 Lipase 2 [Streptomyces ambofaciens ATCC 23877]CAJ88236.1 putative secreted hydrolase [Streptomyces ambofaciens ATCC 23877]
MPPSSRPATAPPGRRAARRAVTAAAAFAALIGATTAASATGPAPAAEPAITEVRYVALGDSFSSGPGVPEQTDPVCGRSSANYATLVARAVHAASFTDVTCAGAETSHMTGPQDAVPPQLDALRPDTTLVTLGIGGNDLDLPGVITRCVLLGYLAPQGAPCKWSYTLLGADEIASRIDATAPRVAAVLDEIRVRSPHARVLVVGYPAIFPDDGTACRATVALAEGDFPWLRDKAKHLNAMLAAQAAPNDATYVDAYSPSVGHEVCRPAGVRWIEPEDTAAAAGFHPNADGHRSTADAVLAALTR